MRLSRISIDGFGLFRSRFDCTLPGTVALIVGANETGKSTIVAAIGAILFGFGSENERGLFAPAGADGPRSGWLEVESKGKTYRFTREFRTNRTVIELTGDAGRILFEGVARPGGRADEKERYNRFLKNIFGMEARELFYNSVFVEQGKLTAKIAGLVRRIVSGSSSTDYQEVLNNLKQTCEELTVAVPWGRAASRKPRRIEQLDEKIRGKIHVLEENRSTAAAVDSLRKQLSALEEQVQETERKLTEATQWQDTLKVFSDALERKRAAEASLNRCRKEMGDTDNLRRERESLTAEMQSGYREYLDLPAEAEKELSDIRASKSSIEELRERLRQITESYPRYTISRRAPIAIGAGVLLAVLGFAFLDGTLALLAVLAGLAMLSIPLLSAAAALQAERAARKGKLSEVEDQLRILLHQVQEREARYPLLAAHDPREALERLRALRRLQAECEKKEEALRQHRGKEDIEAEFNALSNDLLTANHRTTVLKEKHPRLVDIEREDRIGYHLEQMNGDLVKADARGRKLVEERDNVRYRLAQAEAKEILSEEALEEEIDEMQTQLGRLKQHRSAYMQAIDVLEEAISEFHSSHLARIEEKTADHLSAITGKSLRVCLDESLEPLCVEHEGQRFSPDQLSRGTRDQLDFSLRIAAIDEVCDNIQLPIVLDDPFVNFDEERLAAAQKMLDVLSASHQILLLTHDRRYCNWRQPALVLDAPGESR